MVQGVALYGCNSTTVQDLDLHTAGLFAYLSSNGRSDTFQAGPQHDWLAACAASAGA